MGIFTFNKAIFSKSVHLLNQIVAFNQSIRIIRHLGCYQTNETSFNKMYLCRSWIAFRCIYMQLRGTGSALTCTYKCIMFWYFKHKTLNTDIWNYLKMKRYFECEIKIASRWQQVTVNKWVIATEPNHLTVDSFRNGTTSSCCSETQNSAVAVWNYFFVGETGQKQAIWCLKRTSLNINLFFIELLYKINITFVIMLIFEEKNLHSSCDFNHMKYIYIYMHFLPPYLEFCDHS